MKPIRFFTYQETIWYNVADYTQLLLDTHTIWPIRKPLLGKRQRLRQPQPILEVLLGKLAQLNPVYQLQVDGNVYADWVIFEHFYLFIKPYLVHATDWKDPESLFRQIQVAINRPKRLLKTVELDKLAPYFHEIFPNLPPSAVLNT